MRSQLHDGFQMLQPTASQHHTTATNSRGDLPLRPCTSQAQHDLCPERLARGPGHAQTAGGGEMGAGQPRLGARACTWPRRVSQLCR